MNVQQSQNLLLKVDRLSVKAPSKRIRIFLNPQLFLSGYSYRGLARGIFLHLCDNVASSSASIDINILKKEVNQPVP